MRPPVTHSPLRSLADAIRLRLIGQRSASIPSAIAHRVGAIAVVAGAYGGGLGGQMSLARAAPPHHTASEARPELAGTMTSPNSADLTPTLRAQTPITQTAEEAVVSAPDSTAPSVIWLLVMPAVPIVGGTLIYFSRRWFGGEQQECRLVAHIAPPLPAPPEETPQDDESS